MNKKNGNVNGARKRTNFKSSDFAEDFSKLEKFVEDYKKAETEPEKIRLLKYLKIDYLRRMKNSSHKKCDFCDNSVYNDLDTRSLENRAFGIPVSSFYDRTK